MKYLFLLLLPFLYQAQEVKAEFKKEVKVEKTISYVLDYPQNAKGNVPLIVFLHGSGERGNNLEMVKAHSPFTYKNLIKEPVAILAPQCPENTWWDTQAVYFLIKEIQQKYKIDVYFTKNNLFISSSPAAPHSPHETYAGTCQQDARGEPRNPLTVCRYHVPG